MTANITKNQNFSSDNVLLSEKTFKDAYLFNKDGGILARLYDISAKLLLYDISAKVVISDTTLDREAV